MKRTKTFARGGALLFASLGVASCGGFSLGPGESAVLRIGYAQVEFSESCFANGTPDTVLESDLRAGQTVLIYAANTTADAEEPALFLDIAGTVLHGEESESGTMTFTGETSTTQGPDNVRITEVSSHRVDLEVDSEGARGSYTLVTKRSCAGECTGVPTNDCTAGTDFVGIWIEDAEVLLEVGNSNPF